MTILQCFRVPSPPWPHDRTRKSVLQCGVGFYYQGSLPQLMCGVGFPTSEVIIIFFNEALSTLLRNVLMAPHTHPQEARKTGNWFSGCCVVHSLFGKGFGWFQTTKQCTDLHIVVCTLFYICTWQ